MSDFREQLLVGAGVEAERVVEFSCGEDPGPGRWRGALVTVQPCVVISQGLMEAMVVALGVGGSFWP